MNKNHFKFVLFLLFFAVSCVTSFAQESSKSSKASTSTDGSTTGIRTPIFVGGALGFGSGTGVGTEKGLGLRQIEPMVGIWFPQVAFFRVGYGFFDCEEKTDDGDKVDVEHTNLDVELGVQLLGDVYLVGNYSRLKDLSDVGDVAWNEWGVGVGSLLNIFSRTMFFAEVGYRMVLEHFDPFLNKKVSGSRVQLNLGFAAYVY